MRALLVLALLVGTGCLDAPPSNRALAIDAASWFPDNPKAQQLILAADAGRVDEVRRLMKDEGVNPDKIFSREAKYPLIAFLVMYKYPKPLQVLLENGADPNARHALKTHDRGIRTQDNAMVWAAKADDTIYLKLLLDHGGDPNTRNANNETLLVQAFLWGKQWQNVKLLVERGADVNAKTRNQPFISEYAGGGGFEPTYWLLQHGANPDNDDEDPAYKTTINAIFWYPSKPGYVEWQRKCQQWLLERGYKRTPMPSHIKDMRKSFGYPTEEKDIPLL
ncbi:ankyrin repeat domain-containing protein [Lysobacter sp. ISL-42]|nr:ankyrin repeat domain-containing protein [Lysobacter sp. ISL-42]MBT2752774.1 ankyrin repeat domain-containing protein [Lysobacter sp. ISL-50]MBT2779362.1 ankyrin repeat domain-containing protein [Lysobacter sp. ISL-54]MBT2781918.1 ankyrin repeat domain-containing protein [Lysobacter sp. ISL-52]